MVHGPSTWTISLVWMMLRRNVFRVFLKYFFVFYCLVTRNFSCSFFFVCWFFLFCLIFKAWLKPCLFSSLCLFSFALSFLSVVPVSLPSSPVSSQQSSQLFPFPTYLTPSVIFIQFLFYYSSLWHYLAFMLPDLCFMSLRFSLWYCGNRIFLFSYTAKSAI